jgi:hypothetical protein
MNKGAELWMAGAAAAGIIAQQVAAKVVRDALFLSSFPATLLPYAVGAGAGLSLLFVLLMSRLFAHRGPAGLLPPPNPSRLPAFLWSPAHRRPATTHDREHRLTSTTDAASPPATTLRLRPAPRLIASAPMTELALADRATWVAEALNLPRVGVLRTLELLDGGATVPFIARYRKEATGGLDDAAIQKISQQVTTSMRFWSTSRRTRSRLDQIRAPFPVAADRTDPPRPEQRDFASAAQRPLP